MTVQQKSQACDGNFSQNSATIRLAVAKGLAPGWLAALGVHDGENGAVLIPYRDMDGNVLFERTRNPDGCKPRFLQPEGIKLMPYGLDRLADARQIGELVLTEGESDTWSLWAAGIPALGLPGAGVAGSLQAEHLQGIIDVIIAFDADAEGKKGTERVLQRLAEIGYAGDAHRVRLPDGIKDVSDFRMIEPGTFFDRWRALYETAERLAIPPKRVARPPQPPPSPELWQAAEEQRRATEERHRAYAAKALADECQRVASAREGRNNTLNKAAFSIGQLVGANALTRSEAEAALLDAALSCDLSEMEAKPTIKSGLDAGAKKARDMSGVGTNQNQPQQQRKRAASPQPQASNPPASPPRAEAVTRPRELPPWVPFPVDALPAPLVQLVRATSEAMGCDPAYVALPVLAVCAAAIGNSRTIEPKLGWRVPAVLWTVSVGESGTLKSPPFRLAMKPLYAIQKEAQTKHKAALALWEGERAIWKERCREARENGSECPPEQAKPTLARALCSDITVERLAELLNDNHRGLLLSRDELSGWFGSFTRYKARGAGSDVPNWLEMYDAHSITVDRKTGEQRSTFVERAAVSVTGTIQPGTLTHALTTEAFESGLAARLLFAWPPRRKKKWTESIVNEAVEDDYNRIVRALLALTMHQTGESKSEPHRLQLDQEAKALWVEWYDSWAKTQDSAVGNLLAMYAKIEAVAARLALVHHLVSTVHAGGDTLSAVSAESMDAGICLARWFAGEAKRVHGSLQEGDDERRIRRLVEWIAEKGGRVRARDIREAGRAESADAGEQLLNSLVEAGLGVWENVPTGNKGGRPTRVFVLTPRNLETLETPE